MGARRVGIGQGRLAQSLTRRARRIWRTATFAAALSFAATSLQAQFVIRSWLPWRTIETAHFAFHYPTELEEWTRAIASRAESIDSAVARIVGYAPPVRTQVVVDDPFGLANGSAWPFLDQPVINLWAAPPNPREDIGQFRNWGEMLLSHEFTHIAHLTRPSRNPASRAVAKLLPVELGPISLDAPRWVYEGYATYVEGRVTGSGRPHGTWRAAVLRQWALEGQLPPYELLDDAGGFEGGDFAYLAGSAFLEWLVERSGGGDSTLVALWRRMTARQQRSFDESFAGVFGEGPRTLYGRFTADLTGKALRVASAVGAGGVSAADTGTIIQRLAFDTGDPAISPDGKRAALVVRSAILPSRVVVWSTAPEPDTGRARRDSILLARDPEDVPARAIYPPPKKALATLVASSGSSYGSPRFLLDGRILLSRNAVRRDGSFRNDLYLWNPTDGDVRRITHGAALHEPDPSRDGRVAIATQCRVGWCDVVLVSLADGAVRTLIAGSPRRSYYKPRFSPDGSRFVVAVNDDGTWQLLVSDTLGTRQTALPGDGGASSYDAEWLGPSTIVAVTERGGIANLARYEIDTREWSQLTRVTGAAVAPAVNPADSSVWFLSLYSRGYDVRRVRAFPARRPEPTLDAHLEPAVPPATTTLPTFAVHAPTPPRPFGLSPRSLRWIPQPEADADGAAIAFAIASSDLVGRSDLLVNGEVGNPAEWHGGALQFIWRGMRPFIRFDAFDATQRPTASRNPVVGSIGLDSRLAGAAVSIDETDQFDSWAARYKIGGTAGNIHQFDTDFTPASTSARVLGFADAGVSWAQRGSGASTSEFLNGTFTSGRSADAPVNRGTAGAGVTFTPYDGPSFAASSFYGRTNADASPTERFALGGGPSTLVDRDLITQRVSMPALPVGAATGPSVLAARGSIILQSIAVYGWSGSTAAAGRRFESWQKVWGLEWSRSVSPVSIAGTPAARFQLGVAKWLNAPFERKFRGYASVVLNP